MDWDIKGKYCMVTGASSGIGLEIALGLAKLGAHVIMVCRDLLRGKAALEYICRESANQSVDLMLADLSSQDQIRELATAYRIKSNGLHVLINNAGIIMDRRELSVDGVEMTFAVNYLAYFMLTNLLIDLLKDSAPARIINITSDIHRNALLDFDNLQGEKKYDRDRIYAQSKLADIIFTNELARRLDGTGVTANSVCPGAVSSNIWAHSSKAVDYFFKVLIKGPQEGAKVPVYLASSAEVAGLTGKYFQTRQHLKISKVETQRSMCQSSAGTYSKDTAQRLWAVSGALTGVAAETL
jgi:NAD(P)-dependent dehydrogenase (short-subunit alcohol dehydrogenase family)